MNASCCTPISASRSRRRGQYAALVQDGQTPRVGYTVGLTEDGLPEVVLAGGMALLAKPVLRTLKSAAVVSRAGRLADGGFLNLPGVGPFRAFTAHPSWARLLLGRARDYYDRDDIPALQLVPDGDLRTLDVPDMSAPWDPEREPIWRWLVERWESEFPPTRWRYCDLDALRGVPIAQAARWEDAQWQMFTRHDRRGLSRRRARRAAGDAPDDRPLAGGRDPAAGRRRHPA